MPGVDRSNARRRAFTGRAHMPATLVVVLGLVITGVLSWLAYLGNSRNEARLLRSQVRQTGALLQAATPTVQTPLASAVEVAAAGGVGATRFSSYMSAYVGTGKPFMSAALWQLDHGRPRVLATIGAPTALSASSTSAAQTAASAVRSQNLAILGPLGTDSFRLGYAYASSASTPRYVVYAESALPAHRKAQIEPGSPFANLQFALYLGKAETPDRLLETNVAQLPLRGRTATVAIPFGSGTLSLVASSSSQLGGGVSQSLWWIIALAGCALTAASALTAERLVTRRLAAEALTVEVQKLLGEQRTIAEALQHALLPSRLPNMPQMDIVTRYVPGTDGVEIGGDWYDVVPLHGDRFFFAIGDVSGRGPGAGSVMASLLFASRAFVSENHSPAAVLNALTGLLDIERDGHFATMLCGIIDLGEHTLTIANAGHLPPLLVSRERTEYVAVPPGRPLGVPSVDGYASVTLSVPAEGMLVAYTDGLVERRDETLDDGLRRLMDVVTSTTARGETLVEELMATLLPEGSDDDTAVLGLQWHR